MPISPKRPGGVSAETTVVTVKQLLTDAAIQLGISEIKDGRVALIPEKAAKLRRVLSRLVHAAAHEQTLPEGHTAATLAATAFRSAVDLGPLGAWLDDPTITEIRIQDPSTIMLRRGGTLLKEDNPFTGKNTLSDAMTRLNAGLIRTNGSYFLEDGVRVTEFDTSLSKLFIDKKWGVPRIFGQEKLIGNGERDAIVEAIASDAKIAVVGKEPMARRAILQEIVAGIPTRTLTAVVGALPAALDFPFAVFTSNSQDRITDAAVEQAVGFGPDWLVLAGGSFRDIPWMLAIPANRLGVVVELPLGAINRLNQELAVSLTTAGFSPTPIQAALYLDAAFDIIVVTDVTDSSVPVVTSVLASAVNEKGAWAPRILYQQP